MPRTWPDGTLSTRQAADLARVTYRQADYLDRTRLLPATHAADGSGDHRRWTRDDVYAMAAYGAVSALLDRRGLPRMLVRRIVECARDGSPTCVHHAGPVLLTVDLDAVRRQVDDDWPAEIADGPEPAPA